MFLIKQCSLTNLSFLVCWYLMLNPSYFVKKNLTLMALDKMFWQLLGRYKYRKCLSTVLQSEPYPCFLCGCCEKIFYCSVFCLCYYSSILYNVAESVLCYNTKHYRKYDTHLTDIHCLILELLERMHFSVCRVWFSFLGTVSGQNEHPCCFVSKKSCTSWTNIKADLKCVVFLIIMYKI